MACDYPIPTVPPVDCIQTVITAVTNGDFLTYETRKAALVTGLYINSLFPGEQLQGPLAIGEPLTDKQAVERLQALIPVDGQPQAVIDPKLLRPVLTWLFQMILDRLLKG